jgi:hypothetical protein
MLRQSFAPRIGHKNAFACRGPREVEGEVGGGGGGGESAATSWFVLRGTGDGERKAPRGAAEHCAVP